MAQASGVYKQLAYKVVDGTAGIAASGAGGKLLRRVTSTIDLSKDAYGSNEIRSDFQRGDLRHGVKRASGTISGELSPATYADFISGSLKKNLATIAAFTGLSITVAGSGPTYTITRATGDWLTAGVKKGMTGRLTAGAFVAGNLNKNVLCTIVTATVLTVVVLNASTLTAEGPIGSATFTLTGKITWVPTTGHIEKYFSIEEWSSEVPHSGTGYDLRVSSLRFSLPATGLATIAIELMGKDVTDDTTQRFTSPTAVTTTGLTAAVNGVVLFNGTSIATITSLDVTIASAYTGEPVVGSNTIPSLSPGRVVVDGNATIKFTDTTYFVAFRDETEVDLVVSLTTTNAAAADFFTIALPRVKLNSATRDDGEKELLQTVAFAALYNTSGGTGISTEATTVMIQDSAAP